MAKKPRPMGYVFPKRIKEAMQGGDPMFGRKYYMPIEETEEDKERKKKEKEEKQAKQDALKEIRDLYTPPDFCPVCSKNMKRVDRKFWRKREICLDCVSRVETNLKATGKFKEYEEQVTLRNYKAYLTDIREQAEEFVSNLKDEVRVVNHDGSFDTLKGDMQKVRDFITKEIEDLDKKLDEVKDIDLSQSAFEVIGIDLIPLAKKLYEEYKEVQEKKKAMETESEYINK